MMMKNDVNSVVLHHLAAVVLIVQPKNTIMAVGRTNVGGAVAHPQGADAHIAQQSYTRDNNKMKSCESNTAAFLTLAEIAAWQIPQEKPGVIVAALPALQRSGVWKVRQIEELWDSILRRFPIGAFIISPPNGALNQQNFKLQSDQDDLPEPTHLLLDGQQRATGIALGFYDLWGYDIKEAKSVLWLDLAEAPKNREVEFVFRVVTQAHPWGYKRSEPDDTLSANQVRTALQAFRAVNQFEGLRPERFALQKTWPWDAEASVPMAMLIDAVKRNPGDSAAARAAAWKRIKTLPMYADNPAFQTEVDGGQVVRNSQKEIEKQCQNVRKAFELTDSTLYHRLDFVLQRLQELLAHNGGYQVPVLSLDLGNAAYSLCNVEEETTSDALTPDDAAKKDAIELLFVRVNSAGTPLAGEELTYSLLKAAWPDAAKFIDGLDHKPAQASRIAMLCVRLVLARRQLHTSQDKKLSMPPVQGVNEFRRLVRDQNPQHPTFSDDLKSFIKDSANALLTATWQFLVDSKKSYTLLPVIAVELAQKSPDVYLLLLCWADRLMEKNITPAQINETAYRRTLGFLTALAWFAPDKSKACSAIWSELQEKMDNENLIQYFNNTRFQNACRLDKHFNLCMIPLPSVKELNLACSRGVTGQRGCRNTISSVDSSIWKEWNWYTSFTDLLVREGDIKAKWAKQLAPEDGAPDLAESTLQVARRFLDTLYDSHSILLYAQRDWLRKWYPDFDPSQPEYMEDKNRPWDYDHIHPQNLLRSDAGNSRRNIPQVIWDWHGSIGNLRAWPLEANRADSDISPTLKLKSVNADDKRYSVNNGHEKRNASFVQENAEWEHWQNSVPMSDDGKYIEDKRYLALAKYHDNRKDLIKAIVARFVSLYRVWYDELRIGDLQ
ncbi:DUF262 domain-containing protein [Acidithiobacillus concretivorus]|uniref:DUF262 domain-containing protein n=1 Tax=Acidithiobacillus concretivorus TaxID=3063952 RepID=UPI001C070B5B|nr:DUF262 domain-containing protein [Acidithiobacillus concretivorus]